MAAFVTFEDVSKVYHSGEIEIRAVDHISFTIEKGEFCVIVGPSGAGKTTVLNMLGGMDACSGGTITVDGTLVSGFTARQLTTYRRHDIGFVFQFYNLVGNLTALENVELAAQICKDPLDAATVLNEVGLSARANNFPGQLSGGEQQRVAIARALANKPRVLLSDEATSALDPDATEAILNLLRDLNRKLGLTIVLITHEMAVIKSICRRVAVMENGRVVEEGDVYDVFAHPRAAITRRFVASASALSKVDKLIEEGSALVKPAADEKLVRLTFHKDCVGEHVISTVSREFGVDINIVLANVEVIEDNPLGGMVALLGGGEKQVAAALHYLNENHVYTEVIADGSI